MNKVEIVQFETGKIEIKSTNLDKKMNAKLSSFLSEKTGNEWSIINSNESKALTTIKDDLVIKAIKTSTWSKVLNHFPEAKITDILLKK